MAAAIVIVGIAAFLIIVHVNQQASRTRQEHSLAHADQVLVSRFNAYHRQTTACEKVANPYRCIEKADAAMASHLDDFVNVLSATHNVGIGQGVIDQAAADAKRAARAFRTVGRAAPTKAAYTDTVNQTGIFGHVHGLENSVNTLANRLNQIGIAS